MMQLNLGPFSLQALSYALIETHAQLSGYSTDIADAKANEAFRQVMLSMIADLLGHLEQCDGFVKWYLMNTSTRSGLLADSISTLPLPEKLVEVLLPEMSRADIRACGPSELVSLMAAHSGPSLPLSAYADLLLLWAGHDPGTT